MIVSTSACSNQENRNDMCAVHCNKIKCSEKDS